MGIYFKTKYGQIFLDDALGVLKEKESESVNLIMTSPPFGLVRKKEYGNADAERYLEWFRPFATEFYRVLAKNGSFVIDIGGSWNPGYPVKYFP